MRRSDTMIVTYPTPDGMVAAKDIHVSVNGQELFVHDSRQGAFVSLSTDEAVTVSVTVARDFERVDVRPTRRGIAPNVDGRTITFELDRPGHVVVELDGDIERPLFVFASPLETNVPTPSDPGVRFFEAAKVHEPGPIELASNETLYIEGGAVVRASVHAAGATNIRMAGRGILDATDLPRGHLIRFTDCENVEVEGIVAFNNPAWNCVPWSCRNVHIDNIKIIAWRGACDGIDVVSCQDVLIENCFVRNEDDCVAIKAHGRDVQDVTIRNCVLWNGMPGNALEVGFDLECERVSNIVFADCDVIRVEDNGVLTIHNGDTAVVENVRFENIHVEDARDQLIDVRVGLSVWSADCPDRHRPRFDDDDYVWTGSWLKPRPEQMGDYAAGRGSIRNITFKNITVHGDRLPESYLLSYDATHGVTHVTFENLRIAGEHIHTLEGGRLNIRIDDWVDTETDPAEVHFIK